LVRHNESGYGFIQPDGESRSSVFVHNIELRKAGAPIPPPLGTRWQFEIIGGPKGLRAINLYPSA
jgi:cold shock CspA family protein